MGGVWLEWLSGAQSRTAAMFKLPGRSYYLDMSDHFGLSCRGSVFVPGSTGNYLVGSSRDLPRTLLMNAVAREVQVGQQRAPRGTEYLRISVVGLFRSGPYNGRSTREAHYPEYRYPTFALPHRELLHDRQGIFRPHPGSPNPMGHIVMQSSKSGQ